MENIETFINSKYGRAPISYPHPSLKELLDETYGIIVYQDQVLLILRQFAGYTLGSADIVRKAMGKKIASLMAQERERFIKGAENCGYAAKMGEDVFNLIEPFAGYAFNKAHSVSYGLVSYWTAYFKAHYPVEYMASALNSRLDHPDKIVTSINECFNMDIPILLPDINRSGVYFTIDKDSSGKTGIRFGLAAIKGVGEGAVEPLVAERRQKGEFESIDDFCRRADVSGLNKRTLEALAKAGCFDSLAPRGAVLQALDQIIATAQQETRMRQSGQFSMFGGEAAQSSTFTAIPLTAPDLPAPEKATHEKELLGVALSHNPLWSLASLETGGAINSIEDLDEESQGQTLTLQGHVTSFTERFTREQKRFLIVNLDLLGGAVECIVWPDVLERTQELWQAGKIVRATGKLRLRGDQFSLACEQVEEYTPGQSGKPNGGSKPAGSTPPQRGNGGGDYAGRSYGAGNGGARGKPVAESRASYSANRGARGNGMNGGNGRPCAVCLSISETDDPSEDAHRLRDVVRVMLEYPGRDKALLDIHTSGKRVILELPVVAVAYCDELKQRLEAILGENTVTVQRDAEPELEDVPF